MKARYRKFHRESGMTVITDVGSLPEDFTVSHVPTSRRHAVLEFLNQLEPAEVYGISEDAISSRFSSRDLVSTTFVYYRRK